MIIDLSNTTASKIASALVKARRSAGSPAMGMVLTLIVVADESNHYDAMKAAMEAAKEHPSRILGVIPRGGRGAARLDAEVRVGGESGSGESVLLRLYGELSRHAESVVMPLLLPESPVVVWWPHKAPDVPSEDPVGQLSQRRVTDAAASRRPLTTLSGFCHRYQPGDTDLSWTRTTPWRALLAAALDQPHGTISSATVEAERGNASADLLAAWIGGRLGVPTKINVSRGPGITAAILHTDRGDLSITRPDGRLAQYSVPGQPNRHVALKRRETYELLAEELRRLDPDDVYAETVDELLRRTTGGGEQLVEAGARRASGATTANGATATRVSTGSGDSTGSGEKDTAKKAPAKKSVAKKAPAKKSTAKKTPAKRTSPAARATAAKSAATLSTAAGSASEKVTRKAATKAAKSASSTGQKSTARGGSARKATSTSRKSASGSSEAGR
ncbi:glucose-6-phosphate dehydrogenase assembly protein OpcA [Actinopolymorpha pittospori]